MPRSIDTHYLVVYEPYRALEGLKGVGFQVKKEAGFEKKKCNKIDGDFQQLIC